MEFLILQELSVGRRVEQGTERTVYRLSVRVEQLVEQLEPARPLGLAAPVGWRTLVLILELEQLEGGSSEASGVEGVAFELQQVCLGQ